MAIFLNVPVRTGAPARLITIFYEGKEVRKEQLQISSRPDMWASIPLPDGEPDGYSFSLAGDGAEPLREQKRTRHPPPMPSVPGGNPPGIFSSE